MDIYEILFDHARSIPCIDAHIHIPGFPYSLPKDTDILMEYLTGNINCDLVSSSLPLLILSEEILLPDLDISSKWALLEPYWRYCRYTTYAKMLDATVHVLYNINGLSADTIETANNAFRQIMHVDRLNGC